MTTKVIREIETRTVRELTLDEVEEALRDQYDLHVQDDITFDWDVRQGSFVGGVRITHVERKTEEVPA